MSYLIISHGYVCFDPQEAGAFTLYLYISKSRKSIHYFDLSTAPRTECFNALFDYHKIGAVCKVHKAAKE